MANKQTTLTEIFYVTQPLQAYFRTVPQSRPRSFHSTSFPIHSPAILHFQPITHWAIYNTLNKLHRHFPHQKSRSRTRILGWMPKYNGVKQTLLMTLMTVSDSMSATRTASFFEWTDTRRGLVNDADVNGNYSGQFIRTSLLTTVFIYFTTC